jgi:hypothetical protein
MARLLQDWPQEKGEPHVPYDVRKDLYDAVAILTALLRHERFHYEPEDPVGTSQSLARVIDAVSLPRSYVASRTPSPPPFSAVSTNAAFLAAVADAAPWGAGSVCQPQATIVQGACDVTSHSTLPVVGVRDGITLDHALCHCVP